MRAQLLLLLVFLPYCLTVSFSTFLERSTVLLNADETNSDQINDHFNPLTHHYITLPVDFPTTNGFTVEFWAIWRGHVLCTTFFRTDGNCPGLDQTPLLFYYKDSTNFIYLTPAVNTTLYPNTVELFGIFGSGVLSVSSTGFPMKNFTLNDNPTTVQPEGFETFRWYHISFSYNPSGNSELVLSRQNDAFTMDTYVLPLNLNGFNPAQLAGGNLYLGGWDETVVTPPAGTARNYALADIAEVRVWDRFRASSEVGTTRLVALTGMENGLIHYWKFDEASGVTLVDSVGTANGMLKGRSGDVPALPKRWFTSVTQEMQTYTLTRFFSLTQQSFNVQPQGSASASITTYNRGTLLGTLTQLPHGVVTGGNLQQSPSQLAVGNFSIDFSGAATDRSAFKMNYTPNRQDCGTTQSLALYITTSGYSSNTVTFTYQVNSTGPVSGVTFGNTISTEGGTNLQVLGNLGLNGPLAPSEFFRVVLAYQNTVFDCTPTISNGAINCPIGEGFGFGDLQTSSCGSVVTFPNIFKYEAPTFTSKPSGTNNTQLRIEGTNFGPSRIAAANTVQLYDSTNTLINCPVTSITHTLIFCNHNNQLTSGQSYAIVVNIGGQSTNDSFEFNICDEPCKNGGRCVDLNTCDCTGTSYTGPVCANAIACVPECKNGGQCILSSDGGTTCECKQGYSGKDCGSKGSQTLAIALGVVGGLLLVIAILVVVVIIIARRKPARYSKFIPLEKKDFTKIIYGEQLNESVEKGGDIKKLEQLLLEDDMKLVSTISQLTQITEADKIAKALVIIFQANDKVIPLLERFIIDEVEATEHAGNLFRSNSMVSKMFKFYSRLIGLPYLYLTIGPEIAQLVDEKIGIEVDPDKMEEGSDLDEMRWMLMAQSQKILKEILNSSEKCPSEFRELFIQIEKTVKEKYPENVRTTIGGFIFLRFFCPAVSSPEAYGIVEEPPEASSRRLLILITKVLQNLSNDVEFGAKEPYMAKMNDFVQANREKLAKFYDKLLKPPTKSRIDVSLPKNIKNVSLSVLCQHISSILDKVEDKTMKAKLDEVVAKD